MSIPIVVTTIHEPTHGIEIIAKKQMGNGGSFFVVGDRKTPPDWNCPGAEFLSFEEQMSLPYATSRAVPPDSYTRKMLGYLVAFASGATWIRETDDDNSPYDSFFDTHPDTIAVRDIPDTRKWVNIYRFFTDLHVWPRGFPLRFVQDSHETDAPTLTQERAVRTLLITQGLADGDPDVDAVYRMTTATQQPISFEKKCPIALPHGVWTPFNSQATTWPCDLLPLMYLPATCSFRMTDIWRSFVAQRLLPGLGASLIILGPTVYQDRNAHDLMRDFRDEVEGYVGYEKFVSTLEATSITGGFEYCLEDLRNLYRALVDARFFSSEELHILDAWLSDMKVLGFGRR